MLEIAKEYRRVCEHLGLQYFLDSGTLLGAVRHKGFIPWDDDLDVGMMRREYDVFIEKAPEILDSNFFLQTWFSDGGYGFAFAKLRMKNTVYREKVSENANICEGLFIDIFPYDTFPLSCIDRFVQGAQYYCLKRSILIKSGYTPWKSTKNNLKQFLKRVGYVPLMAYSGMHSKKELISKYTGMCTRFNGRETGLLYEQAGAANYGKWVIPADCFKSYLKLEFEGELFFVPGNYDKYLKTVYGDYMVLPPEHERHDRHQIVEVEL